MSVLGVGMSGGWVGGRVNVLEWVFVWGWGVQVWMWAKRWVEGQ